MNCANAHSVDWFNTGGNWANPKQSGKIGAGDTVHLCGTFTGIAGQNLLVIQNNGAAGSPIIIYFEPGVILQAPYWGTNDGTNPSGGAISVGSHNYIIVDGGSNGKIQNTLNGTNGTGCIAAICPGGPCTQNGISAGVFVGHGAHDIEIKNLMISDMGVRTPCSLASCDAGGYGIFVQYAGSNILVHHNTTTYAHNIFFVNYDGNVDNWQIYNNTMSLASIPLVIATAYGKTLTNLKIYNNELKDTYVGQDPDNMHHLNGIMIFCSSTLKGEISGAFYNNYIHGDFGGALCGWEGHISNWFQVDFGNSPSGCAATFDIYNNLLVSEVTGNHPMNGYIGVRGRPSSENKVSTFRIYNNTIDGGGNGNFGMGLGEIADENITVQNNIIKGVGYAAYVNTGVALTADHNFYYDISLMPDAFWSSETNAGVYTNKTLTDWHNLGRDLAVSNTTTDPNLNSDYTLQSSSPAKDAGVSLSSYLSTDKNGISRPQGSAWDIGAYEYVQGRDTTPPAAPRGLAIQ